MEAPNARRAFPCFDEPNMKAIFTITVGLKIDIMSAISNMPVKTTEPMQGKFRLMFVTGLKI
jgi:aminopeptidase N